MQVINTVYTHGQTKLHFVCYLTEKVSRGRNTIDTLQEIKLDACVGYQARCSWFYEKGEYSTTPRVVDFPVNEVSLERILDILRYEYGGPNISQYCNRETEVLMEELERISLW